MRNASGSEAKLLPLPFGAYTPSRRESTGRTGPVTPARLMTSTPGTPDRPVCAIPLLSLPIDSPNDQDRGHSMMTSSSAENSPRFDISPRSLPPQPYSPTRSPSLGSPRGGLTTSDPTNSLHHDQLGVPPPVYGRCPRLSSESEDSDESIPDSPPPFRMPPPPIPSDPPTEAPAPPIGSAPDIPQNLPPASPIKKKEYPAVSSNSRKFARSLSTNLFNTEDTLENAQDFEVSESAFDAHFKLPTHIKIDFSVWTEQRDKIAYEILTTEITYVRNLQILYSVYQPKLIAKTHGVMDYSVSALGEKLDVLFPTIKNILAVNSILLSSLVERYENWSSTQLIGDVLCTLAPFLSIYKVYSKVYEECAVALRAAEKVKDFAIFMETLKNHPLAKRQPIGSFLITPVQRVPRYVLLLRDLLKHTPTSHPDYQELTVALQTLQSVASGIDESISAAENIAKCSQIQELFTSYVNIVEPHRKYIAEGLLLKQCRKDRKERMFYLFTDILIYGIPLPAGRYFFSCELKLVKTIVTDIPDHPAMHIENAIQIQGTGKSFYIFFGNPTDKTKWLVMLNKAIAEEVQRNSTLKLENDDEIEISAPVWQPDESAQSCCLCKTPFTFFYRKHHCRKCGAVVCSNCSQNKCVVTYYNKKSQERVCDSCFKHQ
eukprot:TRINITY_DN7413_c1_g1_i1.p1 TRINITY_DN7413_c1_g1~~TRINITY_DN7413_c1_g1_i1.p1  ORF type:complete len:658 (-),score=95.74 TRINITY_DN7413_c1_g1_i1:140-2113(-)